MVEYWQKLVDAFDVTHSPYLRAVNVGLEKRQAGIRYYRAETYETGATHSYQVKVNEEGVGERNVSCQCAAGAQGINCRHVIAVAIYDSLSFDKPISIDAIAAYLKRVQAYERSHAVAANNKTQQGVKLHLVA